MAIGGGIDFYLLAGVATWPSFFRGLQEYLTEMSREEGWGDSEVNVLYPYGNHTRPLLAQLRDVGRDMMRRLGTEASGGLPPRTFAGAAAVPAASASAVESIQHRSEGRVVVLIGHSGGGVAAYHAARLLLANKSVRECRVVQIGSPKVRIHPALRDKTAYFYAVDSRGRRSDPITRLGTWGGFRRSAAGMPVWDPRRWAPGHIAAVVIDGGHPDYFRVDSAAALSAEGSRTSNQAQADLERMHPKHAHPKHAHPERTRPERTHPKHAHPERSNSEGASTNPERTSTNLDRTLQAVRDWLIRSLEEQ